MALQLTPNNVMKQINFLVDNNERDVRAIMTHYEYNVTGMSTIALKQLIYLEYTRGRDIRVLFKVPYNKAAKNYTGNLSPDQQKGLVNKNPQA